MLAVIATLLAAATATTGNADAISANGATLHGTVSGAANEQFLYGRTTAYGGATDLQTVADGPVDATVGGLTPNTTYHYQLVADDGTVMGGDQTFKTGPNPKPPTVGDQHASAVTGSGAHVAATVNPNGAATTYYFQYGRGTGYGSRTARVTLPAGTEPVSVSADLTGLRGYTRYHWRIYAANALGKSVGRDRTLRTVRVATALSLYSDRGTVTWGRGVTLGGRVSGAGVDGMTLALEQQRFPLDTGFTLVRTTHAGSDGGYLFSLDHVWTLTRYRVVSQTQTPLTSAETIVRSRPRVRIWAENVTRRRAVVGLSIRPNLTGELSVQRRYRHGAWRQVRHFALDPAQGRYGIEVRRHRKRARAYRVIVLPVKGAYVKARSRTVWVTPRPARAKAHPAAAG